MHPSIPHLLDLQSVDHRIAAVRAEIDSFPKKVQEADARLTAARAAVADAKASNSAGLAERKKLELDVLQWKPNRARKYRDQSSAVKTTKLTKPSSTKSPTPKREAAKAEDRQLEMMMGSEDSEPRVKNAEANLREAEKSVNAEKQRFWPSTPRKRNPWQLSSPNASG